MRHLEQLIMLQSEKMQGNKIKLLSQRGFNLIVRGNQALNRNNISYPFISGDAFARTCDIHAFGGKEISDHELKGAKSIFCSSEKLEIFLESYGDKISAEVLLFGNTDRDFYELNSEFPPSVKAVYLQNSHISNSFFHTLPIGIENLRYGRNGLPSLFKNKFVDRAKSSRILVGPFSPTHPERYELEEWKKIQHPRLQVVSVPMRPRVLAKLASSFQFIACPRGNGTDTHRFWETLYRGSVPVVKRSAWSESIDGLGLPIMQLDSWDFEEVIQRIEKFEYEQLDPKKLGPLWMEHWERIVKLDVK